MLRRPRLVVLIASAVSIMLPGTALAAAPTLSARPIQSGLTIPWDIAFAPTGQMIVTERPGRVRVYRNAKAGATLLATTTISHVHAAGEAGVMGIAVDNDFANTRWVYICVSRDDQGAWRNQLIRYRLNGSWHLEFDKYLIRTGMRANTIHNGCAVQQAADTRIWLSMGDSNRPFLAQNASRLNGKILRVNRSGSIPSDNPILPGQSGPTRVYSIGHRNPQGIAFDPETGRAYAIEHGPERDDEINWIRPGRNYGWPCVTGRNHPYLSCSRSTFTLPAWSSEGPTLATSGGVFTSGSAWDSWEGNLMVSTLKQSDLRRFNVDPAGQPVTQTSILFNDRWGRLRAAVMGPGNQLFLTTSNGSNDRVIRITPT